MQSAFGHRIGTTLRSRAPNQKSNEAKKMEINLDDSVSPSAGKFGENVKRLVFFFLFSFWELFGLLPKFFDNELNSIIGNVYHAAVRVMWTRNSRIDLVF